MLEYWQSRTKHRGTACPPKDGFRSREAGTDAPRFGALAMPVFSSRNLHCPLDAGAGELIGPEPRPPALPVGPVPPALAGFVQSLQRLVRRQAAALDVIIVADQPAIVATLLIHAGFSYRRQCATGWMMDAYPRF